MYSLFHINDFCCSEKKINTSMFERGQNPFPDALTSVNDLLNTLGPMPLGKAPREDPYTSSDDEGPPKVRIHTYVLSTTDGPIVHTTYVYVLYTHMVYT